MKLVNRNLYIELVKGAGGSSLYINDYRLAGSKPWGGGTVLERWTVSEKDVKEILKNLGVIKK